MDVAAIMPCRGRAAQTVQNVRRLLATAGDAEWVLWCVGATPDVMPLRAHFGPAVVVHAAQERIPYWLAMKIPMSETDAPLLVNLANDLIPGRHWLARGVAAYRARFGDGDGLMGFNDEIGRAHV